MNSSDENAGKKSDSRGFKQLKLSHKPDFPEILNCVLGVSKSKTRTYLGLLRNQNADIRTLADVLDRSPNTIREQLSTLQEKGLVIRDTRITEEGRYYTYQAVTPDEVKPVLNNVVTYWTAYGSKVIDNLGKDSTAEPLMERSAPAATASTPNGPLPILSEEPASFRNIVTCVFGLPAPVMKLYLRLLDYPRSTAQELAEVQNFARSTVAGRLNDLQDRGLARPAGREITTSNRMAYEYIPRPINEVKERMVKQLNNKWLEYIQQRIKNFDESDLSPVDYR